VWSLEADRSLSSPHVIDTSAAGWIWSGMATYSDANLVKGAGRAGGPGTYAVYTFSGANLQVYGLAGPDIDVDVDGAHHRLGRLKISVDGHLKATVNLNKPAASSSGPLFELTGLAPGNHVLQLEPADGWAVIDYLRLSASEGGVPKSSGKVVLIDRLTDFSHVANHSPNWSIDQINAQYFNGIAARASRTQDTREFLEYRCTALTGFQVRVYTKSPMQLTARVQVYTEVNGVYGQKPIECIVSQTFDGGYGGGWTGFDLSPQTSLPDGTDAIAIVLPAGSGASYDPELAAVSLTAAN